MWKNKTIIVTLLLVGIFSSVFLTNFANAQTFIRPPLPSNPMEEKIAILMFQEPVTENIIKDFQKKYPHIQIRHTFSQIFHGLSVKASEKDLQQLEQDAVVQHVFPSYTYQLTYNPYPFKPHHGENSIRHIGTDNVRFYVDDKGNRLTGKGIKVGVIDTGIDYTHPDLRKNYVKGYDFVDHDSDPMETVNMGALNTIHGTHVAGVICANGIMTGVAPDAQIYVYRALGPGGFGSTEMIIAAIEQAIKDQVDVLNLSLGTSINGPDLPTSIALDKAVEKGIVAVTSNGNSGPDLWTVGTPGTSHKAISVGASTPKVSVFYLNYMDEQIQLLPLFHPEQWPVNTSFFLVDGRFGRKIDLSEKTTNGNIVLMSDSDVPLQEKILRAQRLGAKGVIIDLPIEKQIELEGEWTSKIEIPVAFIVKEDAIRLKKARKNQSAAFAKIIKKQEEDILASFSSRGPVTYNWEIKPDVLAPGVAIESTIPGGYLRLQGTSMASPHVAGAAALLKQAHPDWTPGQIKAVLMNTSKPLMNKDNQVYATYEQGAGRIQLDEAVKAKSIVQPAALRFGKITGEKFEEKTRYIIVENKSNESIRYTFQPPKRSKEIVWDLPEPFTLKPKETRKVPIELEVKQNHGEKEIYDGYLTIIAGTDKIHIPFLYVVNEPDYPRIMSFNLEKLEEQDKYQYDVYLPGGADELGIALFDPDTFQFVDYFDWERNVKRGTVTKKVTKKTSISPGVYIAVCFAKKAGREDYLEQVVEIQ